MSLKKAILILIFFAAQLCFAQSNIQYEDRTYSSSVRTVLLNPGSGSIQDALLPAILPLGSSARLQLSFDILGTQVEDLTLRVIHCNADWTPSNVNSSLWLAEFNDIQIRDIASSYNTRVSYLHYTMPVPKVLLSGNYLVVVYRTGNEEDVLITRRFLVYEQEVNVDPQLRYPTGVSQRNTHQQADFNVLWGGTRVVNPMMRLKPVIRQNYQWYSTIVDLAPSMPRENEGVYEYFYFNGESSFPGLNEFRYFDMRSLKVVGMNIDRVEQFNDGNNAYLLLDRPRKGMQYSTYQDLDGMFAPEHYESKGFTIEPDYVNVTFFLETPPAENVGRIFIFGALSDWKLNKEFEMIYDSELKLYRCTVLLKQGFYNYCYTFLPEGSSQHDISHFEGSFFNTQNDYDFLIYYRPPGKNYDVLIGYKAVNYTGVK